jgi:NAD(P)-dependent dehydrogenase (short-subunit alcohol dehydrogenase family)
MPIKEVLVNGKMVIASLRLPPSALRGEVIVVTGAGGGIGYEAARALLWLGADVIIAEVNAETGQKAAERLGQEFGAQRALFVQTDVGDESSVARLAVEAVARFGKVDVVLNNATIAVLGTVKDLPIEQWDASYRVNLRGPVLLARTFLPGMLERDHGTFVCVSSTGTAFLGGYETFKAAQVHLANTLDAELEGTRVIAFTIGPGLVPTETASRAVEQLAPQMGMSVAQFYAMNKSAILSVEEAGAGFAAAIALAAQFRGQEISSIQALKSAGWGPEETEACPGSGLDAGQRAAALELCRRVRSTLVEQSAGWKQRSLFERQWVIRDFRKTAGMSVEEWLDQLSQLEASLGLGSGSTAIPQLQLDRLAAYYDHMAGLAKGYEKDPAKLEENLRYVYGWKDEVDQLMQALRAG